MIHKYCVGCKHYKSALFSMYCDVKAEVTLKDGKLFCDERDRVPNAQEISDYFSDVRDSIKQIYKIEGATLVYRPDLKPERERMK